MRSHFSDLSSEIKGLEYNIIFLPKWEYLPIMKSYSSTIVRNLNIKGILGMTNVQPGELSFTFWEWKACQSRALAVLLEQAPFSAFLLLPLLPTASENKKMNVQLKNNYDDLSSSSTHYSWNSGYLLQSLSFHLVLFEQAQLLWHLIHAHRKTSSKR